MGRIGVAETQEGERVPGNALNGKTSAWPPRRKKGSISKEEAGEKGEEMAAMLALVGALSTTTTD